MTGIDTPLLSSMLGPGDITVAAQGGSGMLDKRVFIASRLAKWLVVVRVGWLVVVRMV